MYFILQHFIPLGLLWILIVILTGSRDEEQSYREALICTAGAAFVSMIFTWFVPHPWILLRYPLQLIVLFFLVDKVCGCNRGITWRILIWYVLFALVFKGIIYILRQPVEAQLP